YHVISNINYRDLAMMYDIAVRTESESVEFALLDPIPGKTDVLMLNKEQRNEALASARSLTVTISGAERNGIPMPKIVQFDQFIRRLSDDRSERGEYDKGIIDSFPCYAGWVFSRILPDGNVNACLKAHRIPVGNINIDRFKDLWNSLNMKVFRKETAICEKISPFFSQIGNDPNAACGCHRGCDDLGRNMLFHRSLAKLNIIEKITLKTAAKIYRSNVGSR
ncbi:MAG: SPASM domain-containing protein, partial [Candidatus Omnitrophica bacterium]|nr:SPASM domain-containing protein [Candidatus Omnitrophota bacterium]